MAVIDPVTAGSGGAARLPMSGVGSPMLTQEMIARQGIGIPVYLTGLLLDSVPVPIRNPGGGTTGGTGATRPVAGQLYPRGVRGS